MRQWFREGFYVGTGLALILAIYLMWLWGAEHQVRLHTDHLLAAIEAKRWTSMATFVAKDYRDQWGQDQATVLERTRAVFSYVRGAHLGHSDPIVLAENGRGSWQAKMTIEGDNSEWAAAIKDRVNAIPTPFTMEWRRVSGKPWDWKLVRVSNPGLEIPGFE